ncbi:hypothetical protein [Peptoniphilus hominis (ex Hitch et al. 2025)]|uniref:Uncharacterized protein n=1 Tax=Peptoniphilus hominis (ex Hitch et al. 2025) TaxID=3133174 RepID=A0ABV1CF04_9FIRM
MRAYHVYKKEILKNNEIRAEYDALEEEYEKIEEKIKFKQNNEDFSYKGDKNKLKMI